MSMARLSWIVYIGYLFWEPQQYITNPDNTEATPIDQVADTAIKTGTGKVISDHNLILTDIAAQVIMIQTEAAPAHDIGIFAVTPGIAHNAYTPHKGITVINHVTTHHCNLIAYHPHIEVPQLTTPEIIVDHIHVYPTNPQDKICIDHTHTPVDHEANHTTRRT